MVVLDMWWETWQHELDMQSIIFSLLLSFYFKARLYLQNNWFFILLF